MAGFMHVKEGDVVTRMLAGTVPMKLKVGAVDDLYIYCGPKPEDGADPADYIGWKFDRGTGYEEDEDLGWGIEHGVTGSYLIEERNGQ